MKVSEGEGPAGSTPNFANSLGGKPVAEKPDAELQDAGLSGGGGAGGDRPINSQLGTPGEWSKPDDKGTSTRPVPATDGKGDFTEVKPVDGSTYLTRETKDEKGRSQTESISGDRHTVIPTNPAQDAQLTPEGKLSYIDAAGKPAEIKTHGSENLNQTQMDNLRNGIEKLPPAMQGVAKSLYFDKDLGYADSANRPSPRANVAGLASPDQGAIGFRADSLNNADQARDLVAHEYSHLFDSANGNVSSQAPWGNADSVSSYGRTNNREDFAETGANVVGDLDRYRNMTAEQWAAEPQAAKKQQFLSLLGY
ncbi:MAG: hypothetical protein J0I12_18570 [Candidatus Eremiobacteraeota bacterium]|nr:hypothetical protein [Candidatus Eremiobacteraeota bacterium]